MENKQENKLIEDILPLTIGEVAVMLLVIVGGIILSLVGIVTFDYRIITGALLGGLVIIANHLFLTISLDREIKKYMELRGNRELSEEEAEKFSKENSGSVQNAIKLSFIIRMASMTASLVVAFITKAFNPLATAIPLLCFRPLLSITEMIRKKNDKEPDPTKFIE